MADRPTDPAERLRGLRMRFILRAREQGLRIAALRAALDRSEPPVCEWNELSRLCHSLKGAAGTFGFAEVSAAASAEEICDELVKPGAGPSEAQSNRLAAALDDLTALIDRLPEAGR